MNLTLEDLERQAAATGFQTETLEKAIRLLSLLDALRSHPFLKTRFAPRDKTAGKKEVRVWGEQLVSDCRRLLPAVLPLTTDEREFIERLNERGEIVPELLTKDPGMQATIREHPALRWKALNVRGHRGLQDEG